MRLISRTGTACVLFTVTAAASEVTTLRRDINVHIIIIIRPRRSRSEAAYSRQTFA